MKVSTAIKFLSELDENQFIYIQWYDKNDMSKMGVNGEEVIPKNIWKLAVDIAENYQSTNMYTDLEQAIDEAYDQLNLTKKVMMTNIDDTDIYTVEDKPCNRCDERHDDGECGADNPDPDVLYDEMHTQY